MNVKVIVRYIHTRTKQVSLIFEVSQTSPNEYKLGESGLNGLKQLQMQKSKGNIPRTHEYLTGTSKKQMMIKPKQRKHE